MTESEWQSCADPTPMLDFLQERGLADERRLRLFGCACVRRLWHLLVDERSRRAVGVAEAYADGAADSTELAEAFRAADAARDDAHWQEYQAEGVTFEDVSAQARANYARARAQHSAAKAARAAAAPDPLAPPVWDEALGWIEEEPNPALKVRLAETRLKYLEGQRTPAYECGVYGVEDPAGERRSRAALLRCLFPNPFRPRPVMKPAWRKPLVLTLAEELYETRDFRRVVDLAQLLEHAGCDDDQVLGHLREGPHTRGCHVVDALLGRG